MKTSVAILFLLLVFVSACVPAPAPTAAAPKTAPPLPTSLPALTPAVATSPFPTRTQPPSGPTRSPITVMDIQQNRQPDGSIRTTASVTAQDNLGLGQMEIASPDMMLMGETRTIRLRISPATSLASGTPVAAPGKIPDLPNFVYRFSGNVNLYPIMIAEL